MGENESQLCCPCHPGNLGAAPRCLLHLWPLSPLPTSSLATGWIQSAVLTVASIHHEESPAFLSSFIWTLGLSHPSPLHTTLQEIQTACKSLLTFSLSMCCFLCPQCPFPGFHFANFIKESSLHSSWVQYLSSGLTLSAHCCPKSYHPVLRLFVYTSMAFVVSISPSSASISLPSGSGRPLEGRNNFLISEDLPPNMELECS